MFSLASQFPLDSFAWVSDPSNSPAEFLPSQITLPLLRLSERVDMLLPLHTGKFCSLYFIYIVSSVISVILM